MKFIVSFFFRITTVVQAKIPEIKKFYDVRVVYKNIQRKKNYEVLRKMYDTNI